MSSKLEKLIAAYEAERASLTAELTECVAEMDCKYAHLFSKGLERVNQQLQTLYNLKDKNHDEKEGQARSIKLLEERVADAATEEYMRRYYRERIAEAEKKLAGFTYSSVPKTPVDYVVRDALNKLLTGKIRECVLRLQQSKRLHCHIRVVRKTLIMTVPEVRRHKANYALQKAHIGKLQSLGFRWYDNKDKLILFAPYSTLEEISTVQCILARITFEVFYFKELAGDTFITYYP